MKNLAILFILCFTTLMSNAQTTVYEFENYKVVEDYIDQPLQLVEEFAPTGKKSSLEYLALCVYKGDTKLANYILHKGTEEQYKECLKKAKDFINRHNPQNSAEIRMHKSPTRKKIE